MPTGFIRIRRRVLEVLAAKSHHFSYTEGGVRIPIVFERTAHDGARHGGDITFCHKWRDAGGRIFVYPQAPFEHADPQALARLPA